MGCMRVTEADKGIHGDVFAPLAHESAIQHVRGTAQYTDDIREPVGTLHAAIGMSAIARGRIVSIDFALVRAAPGVVAVLTADDVPGDNNYGPIEPDDPIFARLLVEHVGQSIFAVVAHTTEMARRAARLARVEYAELPALIDVEAALNAESFVLPTERLQRGEPELALKASRHRLNGELRIGGQEQFYLEGQVAIAVPRDDDAMSIFSSTQFPMEIQAAVARCLGRARMHDITVECRRMGGAFGGKESQPALFACIAALCAQHTNRPVKLRMDRDDDMSITGKRHDFLARYDVGFDAHGRIEGYRVELASRCGRSADLSSAINDRAMLHLDNAYFLSDIEIVSHRCKTNTVSNTAFRGFGGPQGMLVTESVIDAIARSLGIDALDVRLANLYGVDARNTTPYGMTLEDNVLPPLFSQLIESSNYRQRRDAIAQLNDVSPFLKRGIAVTPVKFGISFTATHLNQAGALLHLYEDGSVQVNHGGTEMGQGLHTKIMQIVAHELQIDITNVRVSATDTSKVPNASATAASSGTDLNGKAAQRAARTIKERLRAFAAEHFELSEEKISFRNGAVVLDDHSISFAQLVHLAYLNRVQLSATGFYKTPKIGYDRRRWSGSPFYYFAYGAAVSEVEIDTLTGESKIRRVDILHDCGRSINPAVDRGQIEGGFLQGAGWLTCEQLVYADDGRLQTTAPSTYKIPACSDWPDEWNVELAELGGNTENTVYRSKAVGEPPLMLAMSVFFAIKDAITSVAEHRHPVQLDSPATPEAILNAIECLNVEND